MVAVERMRARSRPDEQVRALFADGWPAFIAADPVAAMNNDRAREWFAQYELALLEAGQLVAAGWAVPLRWSGDTADLPSGYSDALARAVEGRIRGDRPDTLMICGARCWQVGAAAGRRECCWRRFGMRREPTACLGCSRRSARPPSRATR